MERKKQRNKEAKKETKKYVLKNKDETNIKRKKKSKFLTRIWGYYVEGGVTGSQKGAK